MSADYPTVPSSGFVPPYKPIQISDYLSYAFSGLSILLALYVLLAAIYVYAHRAARPAVDRVSFRLMLLSMGTEVVYNIAYLSLYGNDNMYAGKNKLCAGGVFVMLSCIAIVNYLVTCIAINLMLCVCFGINTVALKLERWYIGVSFFLGLVIEGVPALVGHYGWDASWQDCYIYGGRTARDERVRMFVDLYLWQSIACLISVVAVAATLLKLFQQSRATQSAIVDNNPLNRLPALRTSRPVPVLAQTPALTSTATPAFLSDPHAHVRPANSFHFHAFALESGPAPSFSPGGPVPSGWDAGGASGSGLSSGPSWTGMGARHGSTGSTALRDKQVRANLNRLEDNFFSVAMRISWYPISLILINVLLTVADLRTPFVENIDGMGIYVFYCIYLILYGARGIPFALLAIFVDPCLRRGLRAVRLSKRPSIARPPRDPRHPAPDFAELPRPSGGPTHARTDLTYPRGWSYKSALDSGLGEEGEGPFPSGLSGFDLEIDGDGRSGAGVLNVRMWGPGEEPEGRQVSFSQVYAQRIGTHLGDPTDPQQEDGGKEELTLSDALGSLPVLVQLPAVAAAGVGSGVPIDLERGDAAEKLARRRDSEISFL